MVRAEPLAREGADVAATAAEAVAASRLVVTCLLDDDSVSSALADADLTGRDLFNVTTGTPGETRARAEWARGRGARFVSGGVMAVPPMVGDPDSGGYVFYGGSREAFEEHEVTLSAATGAVFVGTDAGLADLYDVALLSAMNGMFSGIAHAFALVRGNGDVSLGEFAPRLSDWLTAMTGAVHASADQLESGDHTTGVVSNLAMQVRGARTMLRTAEEQGVSTELLEPYTALMARRVAQGHGDEDNAGVIGLLTASRGTGVHGVPEGDEEGKDRGRRTGAGAA